MESTLYALELENNPDNLEPIGFSFLYHVTTGGGTALNEQFKRTVLDLHDETDIVLVGDEGKTEKIDYVYKLVSGNENCN